jgi:hypothetical protein
VDVRYAIYRFRPDRAQNTYYYGDATALTAGLWAIGAVAAADISPNAGISAGVKALTAVGHRRLRLAGRGHGRGQHASGPVPRSEIILTAAVADNARLVSRRTNIYYTMDEDSDLYWKKPGRGVSIPVVGDCGERSKPCAR